VLLFRRSIIAARTELRSRSHVNIQSSAIINAVPSNHEVSVLIVAVGVFYVLMKLGSFLEAIKEKTEAGSAKK
jgi:hypothetical protein